MAALRRTFQLVADAELSIEVDPRTVVPARLAHLRALGFNRVSFGVQDFDAAVQKAVHREQSFESVRELIDSARALGFASINADLIYGLPRQTPESFARTVAQIGACGRTGSRSTPTPTCRRVSSRSDASWPTICPTVPSASPCSVTRWPASSSAATTTSAWITSPCPTMRSPSPGAKAGCSATSRATARSRTAT
jgi:hypothetical protein